MWWATTASCMLTKRFILLVIIHTLLQSTLGETLQSGQIQEVKGDDGTVEKARYSCQNTCLAGMPGVPGINGMHGKDGAHGMPGQPGPMGVQGPPGIAGLPGSRGRKGNAGIDGRPGLAGLAIPGEKGEKGDSGGPVRISRHSGRDNVAFSVSRRNKLGPVTDDTTVTFDKVFTNLGSSFNLESSEFVVKGNGTYIFHLHVMSQENTDCYVWIMLNDRHHLPVYGDARNGYGAGGTTVILELARNDRIWVQLTKGSTLMNDYTMFSGYLLAP